ncbi:MAG: slipin family protein [Schleiferiaceae bacterium]|jgi:regulator of protease activity HflC (stomatin/prohibitin superfamily)|nr:slipin family protein [Schleiferiaceae bacterium]
MKRVRIGTTQVGLVFRNDDLKRVIESGVHWISPFETVQRFDLRQAFYPLTELDILLKDETLASMLTVVDLKDNEFAIQLRNGVYWNIYIAGKHAFWKGLVENEFIKVDLSKVEITEDIPLNILEKPDVAKYVRSFTVEPYEQGVLFVDGEFVKVLKQGTYKFWRNPITVHVVKADMRKTQMEVSGQEILTKDKAQLRINFFAQYQVKDIVKAMVENKDFAKQLYINLQLALREIVGTMTLDNLMESKEQIANYILEKIQKTASDLGTEVSGCGVRDIILPGEVKDIMNQVLVAEKKAQANIITRREETASTRSLLNTAKLMENNEMLFRLKEMEFVEKIADNISDISLGGNDQVLNQLKSIFTPITK